MQYALSHGVPIVAAGEGADKPDVGHARAMVRRRAQPGPRLTDTRRGSERRWTRLLGEPGYRDSRARRSPLEHRASYDTFDVIEAELEAASIVAALALEPPVG